MTIIAILVSVVNVFLFILAIRLSKNLKTKEAELQSIAGNRPDDRKQFKSKGQSSLSGSRPDDR